MCNEINNEVVKKSLQAWLNKLLICFEIIIYQEFSQFFYTSFLFAATVFDVEPIRCLTPLLLIYHYLLSDFFLLFYYGLLLSNRIPSFSGWPTLTRRKYFQISLLIFLVKIIWKAVIEFSFTTILVLCGLLHHIHLLWSFIIIKCFVKIYKRKLVKMMS